MMLFSLADKHISGEIIDDELIIIDLTRGWYFTSKGAALPIWRGISSGIDVEPITETLAARWAEPAEFSSSVDTWLNALIAEGILCEAAGDGGPVPADFMASLGALPFAPPTLEMHKDLKDILLFDPIHDFVELGWPTKPDR